MANEQAFSTGYDQGFQVGIQPRLLQQAHKEQQFQDRHDELMNQRDNLVSKLAYLKNADGTKLPGYDETEDALNHTVAAIAQHWHPDNNPNMIAKYGHLLTDRLGLTKPQPTMTMAIPKPQGLIEPGNINIWTRPTVQNADGSHSTELSISMADDQGHEVLIPLIANGKFMTPDGKIPPGPIPKDWKKASPAWLALRDAAWQRYEQTGEHLGKFATPEDADAYANILHNRGNAPKGIVKQEARQAKQEAGYKAETKSLEAAAPLSPDQIEAAKIQAQFDQIDRSGMTPDNKERARQAIYHIYQRPKYGWVDTPNGPAYVDMDDPGNWPEGAVPRDKPSLSGEELKEYNTDVASGKFKGSIAEWLAQKKPSVSPFNEGRNNYAKGYVNPTTEQGFASFNDLPAKLKDKVNDYIVKKQQYDKLYPTTTTSQQKLQDATGGIHFATVTNYKTPGGGALTLIDPLEAAGYKRVMTPSAQGASHSPESPVAPLPTPRTTKRGNTSNLAKTGEVAAQSGNVKVGPAVLQGRTPTIDAADKKRQASSSAYLDVYNFGGHKGDGNLINPVDSQGIVMAWLRGKVNRVTATEIANVRNLGDWLAKFDGTISSITNGTMTPQQYQWFLESAKTTRDDDQQIYNSLLKAGQNDTSPSGDKTNLSPAAQELLKKYQQAGPQ